MASLETVITVFLVLYLCWAVTLSDKRYHGALSLCLFFFFRLLFGVWRSGLSDLGSLFTSLPLLIAVGTICFFLSPIPAIFHEARASATQSLKILADGEPGTIFMDIVAVHGLASNPASAWDFYSTKEHPEGKGPTPEEYEQPTSNASAPRHHIWLRDALPHEGLNARIMVFNHNTAWRANALNKSLSDYGDGLLHELRKVRKDHHDRPIVFIGHSFGGLIVKQAIVNAHTNQNDEAYKSIIENTKGFVFLGVPHKGTELARLGLVLSMFGHWKGSRTNLLEVLRPDSELNASLHRAFMRILDQGCGTKNTVCVFESVSETFMGLPITEVVNRRSAVIDGSQEIAHDQTHRLMQRSESSNDPQYRTLVHYLSDWAKGAKDTANAIEEVTTTAMTKEQQASFRSLSFYEMNQRLHDVAKEALDTCAWIVGHKAYSKWQERRNSLLWIKGKPGAGKSTIMKYIIRRNQKPSRGLQLSYFLSGRGTAIQKTCSGVYRALLIQIFDQRPDLSPEFVAEYARKCSLHGDHETKWTWHEGELRGFLVKTLLEASGKDLSTQIFVDALDEAGDEEAVVLLEFFQAMAKDAKSALKVCVSSRHYPLTGIEHDLEIAVEDYNADDIATFIRHELDKKVKDKTKAELIETEMLDRARGVFQWVSLVLPRVIKLSAYGSTLANLAKAIRDTPQELDKLYETLFVDSANHEKDLIEKLMRWVCFTTRPLFVSELRHAMAIELSSGSFTLEQSQSYKDSDDGMRVWATDLSRGLVEFRQPEVNLGTAYNSVPLSNTTDNPLATWYILPNHQTVQDFVTKGGLSCMYDTYIEDPIGSAHHYIYRACIHYLATETSLRMAEYFGQTSGHKQMPLIDLDERVLSSDLEAIDATQTSLLRAALHNAKNSRGLHFIDYAVNWPFHAEKVESSIGRGSSRDLLDLLYWGQSYRIYNLWTILAWKGHEVGQWSPFLSTLLKFGLRTAASELLKDTRFSDHNVQGSDDDTALSRAARCGDEAIVRLMLRTGKFNMEIQDHDRYTPLCGAVDSMTELYGTVQLLLLEGKADPNYYDNSEKIPLYLAAQRGYARTVRLLLRHGADIEARGYQGRTPLGVAGEYGHEDVVSILLEHQADPNTRSERLWTPLHFAVEYGRVVELLLEAKADSSLKTVSLETPLHQAAGMGHFESVRLFLEEGNTDMNTINANSQTPLVQAALHGQHEVVEMLLKKKAKPDVEDEHSRTALSYAAEKGHEKIVKMLLNHRADPTSKDAHSRTPLSYAAWCGNEHVIKMLLDFKAVSLDTSDINGKTPLHHALYQPRSRVTGPVQLLVEAGADVNSRDESGETALHYACFLDNHDEIESVSRILLKAGANIDAQDVNGKTILQLVLIHLESAATPMVELLLKLGADVHSRGDNGRTALHLAIDHARYGMPIVDLLLKSGASPDSREDNGYTCLMLAARQQNKRILESLIHHAADQGAQSLLGRTALFYVVGCGQKKQSLGWFGPENKTTFILTLLQLLIEAGADPNHRDTYGRTVLSYVREFTKLKVKKRSLKDSYQPVVNFLEQQGAQDYGDAGVGIGEEAANRKHMVGESKDACRGIMKSKIWKGE